MKKKRKRKQNQRREQQRKIKENTPLYHSPLDLDFIIEVVEEWYTQISHKSPDRAHSHFPLKRG